jgi:hypothetical protein
MQNCLECRRLERLLEEAAIEYFKSAQYILKLDDSDPEKTWADMALRGDKKATEEIQLQFNEHKAKHADSNLTTAASP